MWKRWAGIALVMLGGCAPTPAGKEAAVVRVETDRHTNNGLPFRVLVKETTESRYVEREDRQTVEAGPRLAEQIIVPGSRKQFSLLLADDQPVALYFLLDDQENPPKALWQPPHGASRSYRLEQGKLN